MNPRGEVRMKRGETSVHWSASTSWMKMPFLCDFLIILCSPSVSFPSPECFLPLSSLSPSSRRMPNKMSVVLGSKFKQETPLFMPRQRCRWESTRWDESKKKKKSSEVFVGGGRGCRTQRKGTRSRKERILQTRTWEEGKMRMPRLFQSLFFPRELYGIFSTARRLGI